MKKLVTLLALAFAAAALTACGSDDSESSAPASSGDNGAENIETTAKDGTLNFAVERSVTPAYTVSEAEAPAGKVKIELWNPQSKPHNLVIEDAKGKRVAETFLLSEAVETITANLKPGEYTFFCEFQGHRKAGMEGPLTVN